MKLKEIINQKIAVSCPTEAEAVEFLKQGDNAGLLRRSGKPLLSAACCWGKFKENTCFTFSDGFFGYDKKDHFEDYNYTIIPFTELDEVKSDQSWIGKMAREITKDEPEIYKQYMDMPVIDCSELGKGQEVEDAASDDLAKVFADPMYDAAMAFAKQYPALKLNSGMIVNLFEAGANWQKQRSTDNTDAPNFLDWTMYEGWGQTSIGMWAQFDEMEPITTAQLYSIYNSQK